MCTESADRSPSPLRVTVVGPCASGKTTLVERLKEAGYDAWVTSQEHSVIPELWNHQAPDALIALKTDLETIRQRRGAGWSHSIFDAQMERLRNAFTAAGLIVDTTLCSEEETASRALSYLRSLEDKRSGR